MDEILAATQADLFWLPEHVERLDRNDVLAVNDGTARDLHNQVVRTQTDDPKIPALIEEISAFHTGETSQWLVVPPGNLEALERHLPTFGYAPTFAADAYTVPSEARFSEGDFRVEAVTDIQGLRDNVEVCARGFGREVRIHDYERQLQLCTGPHTRTTRFVAYTPDGEPVGSANINRYPTLGFGFLWAGATVPGWRGRGVYRALLGARCRWAKSQALHQVGLYAKRDTSGPVVAAVGFEKHGPMAYWQRQSKT